MKDLRFNVFRWQSRMVFSEVSKHVKDIRLLGITHLSRLMGTMFKGAFEMTARKQRRHLGICNERSRDSRRHSKGGSTASRNNSETIRLARPKTKRFDPLCGVRELSHVYSSNIVKDAHICSQPQAPPKFSKFGSTVPCLLQSSWWLRPGSCRQVERKTHMVLPWLTL